MPIHFRNYPVKEPFTFESLGNHWEQDRVLRPNGYPLYHYLQTEKGQGAVNIQGKSYSLGEGEGLLVAPFLRHAYAKETAVWTTSFATFAGTLDTSIGRLVNDRKIVRIGKERGAHIQTLIDDIMERWELLSADTGAMSVSCYRLLMLLADSIYPLDLSDEPLYRRYVEPTIREIETHYDTNLTAEGLSRNVYVTPQYLSRLFRRFIGCSVYEYLTTCRINRARELLVSNPRMEVQQIAGLTGFSDTSHFIAMFKKATGLTPLEFRRSN